MKAPLLLFGGIALTGCIIMHSLFAGLATVLQAAAR